MAITDDEAVAELRRVLGESSYDPEEGHRVADDFLCRLLLSLGYEKTVLEFHSFSKWYA